MCPRVILPTLGLLLFASTVSLSQLTKTADAQSATEKEFPYIVSIRDVKVHQHFCGAVIITQRNVLTAGHCLIVRKSQPETVYVVLGVYNRLDNGVRKNVKQIAIHPQFNTTFMHNDIAILTTYTKIEYSNQIQPIALPLFDIPEKGNIKAIASGWGRIVSRIEEET